MRPSRRRLTEQGADLSARNERLIAERDSAREEAAAYKAAAETAARQFVEADEKYVDVSIVNECLTSDLTKARERLAEYGGRRTVAEVLEEHDVHRKALADALGEQKRHLNWDQLIGEVGRLAESAGEWMGDHAKEKARADTLQQRLDAAALEPADGEWRGRARRAEKDVERLRKELDNACGRPPGGLLDGAVWQPGYQAPTPNTKASAS
jgi:chromosome segregation ATPase